MTPLQKKTYTVNESLLKSLIILYLNKNKKSVEKNTNKNFFTIYKTN